LAERARAYREHGFHQEDLLGRMFSDHDGLAAASAVGGNAPVQSGQIATAIAANPSRTDRSIARELGCSATTVGKVREALGLKGVRQSVQRGEQTFQPAY
jgi:hypothetical protein